ncbi:MAG: ROK family transcriptional regulator [Chloroflexi bacterium]|nr:ROK family transcriptional regulator [Chloroflexota bacterium]
MKTLLGNRDLIRAINRSIVLNQIKSFGPIPRAELARRTRLSPATITGIAAELILEGLIYEKEMGDSSGGRRPIRLALNPRGGFVVGVKLTEDHLSAALTDLEATVLACCTTPLADSRLETALASIERSVFTLLSEQQIATAQFLGVGVGLAGVVDAGLGILRKSPFFDWGRNIPLAEMLRQRLGVPVYIDNDVNTLTMTELWFGRGRGFNHFIIVTLGRGLGCGIVIDGKLYQGHSGGVGEFGHFLVDPNGAPCACGKRGCLETFVADPALVRIAAERFHASGRDTPIEDVETLLDLATNRDPLALEVFAQAGELLGRNLANLINLLAPQLIIISGEGVRSGDWLLASMRRTLELYVLPDLAGEYVLQVDAWDEYAWSRGAAGQVLRQIFESPVFKEPAPGA